MRKVFGCLAVLAILGAAAVGGEKNARPQYHADASFARQRARSMPPGTAAAFLQGTRPATNRTANQPLNQQLKKLETQSAKTQSRTMQQPGSKAGTSTRVSRPIQAERNKPINFKYTPPKGSTGGGSRRGGSPRRLIRVPGSH